MVTIDSVAERAEALRAFSRFYTAVIGVLQEGLLKTPYSLTEARVLFELGRQEEMDVVELRQSLGLGPGYMSRIRGRSARGRRPAPPGPGRHGLGRGAPRGALRRRVRLGRDVRGARRTHRLGVRRGDRPAIPAGLDRDRRRRARRIGLLHPPGRGHRP